MLEFPPNIHKQCCFVGAIISTTTAGSNKAEASSFEHDNKSAKTISFLHSFER